MSCKSDPESTIILQTEPEAEVYFSELIQNEEYQQALSELFLWEKDLPSEQYEIYKNQFVDQLSLQFPELLTRGDDLEILKSYVTLQNLGSLNPQWENSQSIRYHQILSCLENEYYAAASVLMMEGVALGDLPLEDLRFLEKAFYKGRQKDSLGMVAEILLQKGNTLSENVQDLLDQDERKADLVNGTVTLWVDKGLKTENGIGIPDRMIGSGFFIDNHGYLITNYHVISSEVDPTYEGYSRLYIKRNDLDGEKIPAKVVGWDPVMDLALVKTEMTVPYNFSFAREYTQELGDSIYAIGSPGGLEKTLTTGSISSQSRNIQALGFSLQVDVPINPGNSGGPLMNQEGKVIGVVYAGIETFEGVNFAIPGSYVKDLLPRLYRGGKVEHSWIGAAMFKDMNRLEIGYTFPDSSARRVGLESGDSIKKVNGQAVDSVTDIQNLLFGLPPGTVISLNIERDQEILEVLLPLSSRPDTPIIEAYGKDARENLLLPVFGMTVTPMDTRRTNRWYRVESVYPGSIADESGIIRNDTLRLDKWEVYKDQRVILLQIILRAQSRGFLESAMQIGSWLDMNHFI